MPDNDQVTRTFDLLSSGCEDANRRVVIRIRPDTGWIRLDLRALWQYRELMLFLVLRDLKVRYKQTLLGAAWVVIQPAATVAIFTVIFGWFAKLPSDGAPYWLHSFSGILPWTLFASTITRAGTSLVSSGNLISKVYFPRMVVPISAALSGLVDFTISLAVFFFLMFLNGHPVTLQLITLPLWMLLTVVLALGIGIALSAMNVRYRDVAYLSTFMLQIWMYASPVVYSMEIVPKKWIWLYQLNPMVGVIEGFRWALLGSSKGLSTSWVVTAVVSAAILAMAALYFSKVERSFADNV